MLYGLLLTLHSWVRWVVVITTLVVGARCLRGRAWTARDSLLGKMWISAIDTQLSLGFLLWFVASPLAEMARADFRAAWSQESLRFFGILHPLAMTTAAVVGHAAWIWTRRAAGTERFRRLGIGVLGVVAIVAIAIPWPFLPWGRALARFG